MSINQMVPGGERLMQATLEAMEQVPEQIKNQSSLFYGTSLTLGLAETLTIIVCEMGPEAPNDVSEQTKGVLRQIHTLLTRYGTNSDRGKKEIHEVVQPLGTRGVLAAIMDFRDSSDKSLCSAGIIIDDQ